MVKLARFVLFLAATAAVFGIFGRVVRNLRFRRSSYSASVRFFGADQGGANQATDAVQKTLKADKVSEILIDNQSGGIEVRPVEDGVKEVHIVATRTIRGNDPENTLKQHLKEVSVTAELKDSALVVAAAYPEDLAKNRLGVTVDYVIIAPPGTAMNLHTGSGNISIRGVKAGATLNSSYGDVDVRDAGGALDLYSSSGSIRVIRALDAKTITAKSNYGDIRIERAAGAIIAETKGGNIYLSDSTSASAVSVHSNYGEVNLSHAAGTIDASSSSGAVTVSDTVAADRCALHSDYGNVTAKNVTAAKPTLLADLSTASGSAIFMGEATEARLHSNYGEVTGSIGSALHLQSAELSSNSGSVHLELPAGVSARVSAATNSGRIDLPGTTSSSAAPATGEASFGSGAARVSLKSVYGDVILRIK